MIKGIGNGKYEVTFPGHPGVITIAGPTDSEIGLYSSTNGNGLWVTILEKAFATHIANTVYTRPNRSLEALDQGVWPYDSIKILTGHEYDDDDLWATMKGTLRSKMKTAFSAGKIVAADIMPTYFHSEDVTSDGLARKHAYSVLGYNPSTDMVKIRNPWGNVTFKGVAGVQGIIEIPMSSFDENFTHIYFES
jgi:hypothetical protein